MGSMPNLHLCSTWADDRPLTQLGSKHHHLLGPQRSLQPHHLGHHQHHHNQQGHVTNWDDFAVEVSTVLSHIYKMKRTSVLY